MDLVSFLVSTLADSWIFFRLFVSRLAWNPQFLGYLRTLSLEFQKVTSKIEVFLSLPCWLSQFSKLGRDRKTSFLVLAFWNFKVTVLKYQWNFRPHAAVTFFSTLGTLLMFSICCKDFIFLLSSSAKEMFGMPWWKWKKEILLHCQEKRPLKQGLSPGIVIPGSH